MNLKKKRKKRDWLFGYWRGKGDLAEKREPKHTELTFFNLI